jgi:PEP-CTERM motif
MEQMTGSMSQRLAVLIFPLMFLGAGTTQAATCKVSAAWNPDATLTSATSCGPGLDGTDSSSDMNALRVGGRTNWSQLDRDQVDDDDLASDRDSGFYFTGSTSGYWYVDVGSRNGSFAIVLKGGSSSADPVRWAWFILDTSIRTSGGCTLSGGYDYCGSWTMYGQNGTIRQVSHATLYNAGGGSVSEPGALALAGIGLLGLWASRRRVGTRSR